MSQPEEKSSTLADLASQELQRWAEKLNAKVPNGGVCRICGKGPVNIAPHIVTPPVWNAGGGFSFGGPSYPQVMTICSSCGNTQYYNAVALGVLEGDAK